eukprot:COSAG03_NODE_22274_length_293_cov_0.793814_1_plen_67_part_10
MLPKCASPAAVSPRENCPPHRRHVCADQRWCAGDTEWIQGATLVPCALGSMAWHVVLRVGVSVKLTR